MGNGDILPRYNPVRLAREAGYREDGSDVKLGRLGRGRGLRTTSLGLLYSSNASHLW